MGLEPHESKEMMIVLYIQYIYSIFSLLNLKPRLFDMHRKIIERPFVCLTVT